MERPIQRVSLADRVAEYTGRAAGALMAGLRLGAIDALQRSQFDDPERAFAPLSPLDASQAPGSPPRGFEVRQGRNISYNPRREDARLTPFAALRSLADSHSITRSVIQSIKQTVCAMAWEIAPTKEAEASAKGKTEELAALRAFVARPDRAYPFKAWASNVLEELLVIDAVTLVPVTDRARRPLALRSIDGATIKPLVDVLGQAPLPPAPAYQQILYGRPETNFTTDEILYRPKNRRAWTPYGQSPLEMVTVTLNLAIRRELHYLAFYTDGNLPDALYMVPSKWTDTQIKSYQQYFDDLLSGDSGRRAGHLHFVPGGDGAGYEATKDEEWKYEFDEYLARVVAWAYGVSPLPIAKMVNRASSEQMDRAHQASGIDPVRSYLKDLIDEYLQIWCGIPWAEFRWIDERPEDQKLLLEEDDRLVRIATRTIDEVRVSRGQDALPNGLGAKPIVFTGTGAMLLEDALKPPEPVAGPPGLGSGAPLDGGAGSGDLARMDLARWRKLALKDFRKSGPGTVRIFRSEHIDPLTVQKTHRALAVAKTEADVVTLFVTLQKRARGPSGALKRASAERAALRALKRAFARAKRPILAEAAERHARLTPPGVLVGSKISDDGSLRKITPDEQAAWDELAAALEVIFQDAATAGAEGATKALGFDFEAPPAEAMAFAREKAAELVGRRWVGDILIDNPNPKWAINETIRLEINRLTEDALAEGWSAEDLAAKLEGIFSESRAMTIARTEVGRAYNTGAAMAYKTEGVELVKILDGAGCLPEGHDDDAPGADEDAIGVQDENEADGQTWDVDTYAGLPLGHPRCVRAASPVVETEMPTDEEETD